MVDPLRVPGQPAHADPVPRRRHALGQPRGRGGARDRRRRLGRGPQPKRCDRLPCRGLAPDPRRGLHDVPLQGQAPERAVDRTGREARRHRQLPDPDRDEPRQVHRLPHLLGHLQAGVDQPARRRVHVVQRRRDQARRRLPEALGGPGAVEGPLGARPQGAPAAEGGRPDQEAPDDLLQPGSARDRRLLRALDLRLREPDHRAAVQARPGGPAPLAAHRRAARADQLGSQLGRQPGGRAGAHPPGPADRGHPGAGEGDLRAGLHVLPAADLRALPEPVLRRLLPFGGDVQARGGRDRPRRSGQVPGLALLRLRLPLQEGLLQPPHGQGREVHALLPADRGRAADDLLGDLRRTHPLHRPSGSPRAPIAGSPRSPAGSPAR